MADKKSASHSQSISLLAVLLLTACGDAPESVADGPLGVDGPDITLDSYEAVYRLSLARGNIASGVLGYDGLLMISWSGDCEGYTSSQRIAADISTIAGGQVLNEISSTAWETRDLTQFRFGSITKINGDVTEDSRGNVERATPTASSEVKFDKPDKKSVALTGQVLFPTQYTIAAIRAAKSGRRVFTADLYDGSLEHIPYQAITVFGSMVEPPAEGDESTPEMLRSQSYWPAQVGYHSKEMSEGIPEFEVSMRFYENGVATHLVLDYGDFALNGELLALNALTDGC